MGKAIKRRPKRTRVKRNQKKEIKTKKMKKTPKRKKQRKKVKQKRMEKKKRMEEKVKKKVLEKLTRKTTTEKINLKMILKSRPMLVSQLVDQKANPLKTQMKSLRRRQKIMNKAQGDFLHVRKYLLHQ